jgi:hypothetical protein
LLKFTVFTDTNWPKTQTIASVHAMTDNGTLRDHLADVINERNELLRKVELLEARLDVLTKQLSALWKVDND